MITLLYIDGHDIYAEYGIYLLEGSYESLLQYPPLKKVEYNDWNEENGIQPDLSAPRYETKNVTLNFGTNGGDISGFLQLITDGAYSNFEFRNIRELYNFKLRLNSQNNLKKIFSLQSFSLNFNDDFFIPDGFETLLEPENKTTGYIIDGTDIGEYGIMVTQGTETELLKRPDTKQNLTRDFLGQNGVIYDSQNVTFKERSLTLHLQKHYDYTDYNGNEWFHYNYFAFFTFLTQPGLRELTVGNKIFSLYYKSSSVKKAVVTFNLFWIDFDVEFVCASEIDIDALNNAWNKQLAAAINNNLITEHGKDSRKYLTIS